MQMSMLCNLNNFERQVSCNWTYQRRTVGQEPSRREGLQRGRNINDRKMTELRFPILNFPILNFPTSIFLSAIFLSAIFVSQWSTYSA